MEPITLPLNTMKRHFYPDTPPSNVLAPWQIIAFVSAFFLLALAACYMGMKDKQVSKHQSVILGR